MTKRCILLRNTWKFQERYETKKWLFVLLWFIDLQPCYFSRILLHGRVINLIIYCSLGIRTESILRYRSEVRLHRPWGRIEEREDHWPICTVPPSHVEEQHGVKGRRWLLESRTGSCYDSAACWLFELGNLFWASFLSSVKWEK